MKAKRLCGLLSIGAIAALALVGCGYDQKTGGVSEQATIVDTDLSFLRQSLWGFNTKVVYEDEIDLANGYSEVAILSDNTELKFNDITGVKKINYTYYKKTNYSIGQIYNEISSSNTTLWDDDKIHLTSNVGTEITGVNNVKENGEYIVVLSFEVNEKRYKPIQDLAIELDIYKKPVITQDNFSFTTKTVTRDAVPDTGVTNYAKVTLGTEVIELTPTLDDDTLDRLGLTGISYRYENASGTTISAPTSPGTYYTFINLVTAKGYQTPEVNGAQGVIVIQDQASTKTVNFVVNNSEVDAIEPKTTTATTIPADYLTQLSCEGYNFVGWYTDAALTIPATINTLVTDGMTLYAKWTQTAFNVTYEENLLGVTSVTDLTKVNKLPDTLPTLTDPTGKYTFSGWYTDAAITTAAVAGATITSDTTLYAKWNRTEDLADGVVVDETFDIINPASISGVTIAGANKYTNTEGKLVITPSGTTETGTIDFATGTITAASSDASYTNQAVVQFTLTEQSLASSWASFALYDGDSVIVDNNYATKGAFAARFTSSAAETVSTEYTKTAGVAYTYTITIDFTSTGMTVHIEVTDGTNPYTIVDAKELTTRTSLTKIRFGNAKDAARILELDNLSVRVNRISAE